MRPLAFSPNSLRKLLLHDKIATLPDLKRALGSDVDLTVFRKLKELDYLTSYSHGGRFYTLREIARFGTDGLWSCEAAWFSRYGTLLATAEAFIGSSVAGYFAEELSAILHVGAQDALRHLVQQKRIARELVSGLFLYTSTDPAIRQRQRLTRRGNQSVPTVVDASRLEVSPHEMKAAIILFYSLLDEQQRRLYAGLGIHETRPRRRQRAGRSSWPRSTHHRPWPPPAAGSGCRRRSGPTVWGRAQTGGKKTPEVIEAIEILLEHDIAGDPITGIRWTHKTPACIAELLRQLDIEISAKAGP